LRILRRGGLPVEGELGSPRMSFIYCTPPCGQSGTGHRPTTIAFSSCAGYLVGHSDRLRWTLG
jgi:hypothetical protein